MAPVPVGPANEMNDLQSQFFEERGFLDEICSYYSYLRRWERKLPTGTQL